MTRRGAGAGRRGVFGVGAGLGAGQRGVERVPIAAAAEEDVPRSRSTRRRWASRSPAVEVADAGQFAAQFFDFKGHGATV